MTSRILCIETATEICSVALSIDGQIVALREAEQPYAHASMITVLIRDCLRDATSTVESLDAVAVSAGPGSYTALRVGFSCAKGICAGRGIPLIGVDTLEALAKASMQEVDADYFVPLIDARRMEVYTAVYNRQAQRIQAPAALVLAPESFHDYLQEGLVAFVGDGAEKWRQLMNDSRQAVFPTVRCSALHLANPALGAWHKQEFQNLAYFSPYYLKPPNITQPKKKF